jgi:DNA-binding Lrp family transcriptional regulator
MVKLTQREKQVLIELLKDCKTSDQEIARRLRTSRPTIFKIRQRLEKQGIIKGYTPVVDFEKLNLEIHATILFKWRDYSRTEELARVVNFIKGLAEVVLFVKGEGIGSKTDLIISLHKNLKDYETFIRRLKYEWKDNVENVETFLSSIEGISKGYDLSGPIINSIQEKIIHSK